MARVAGQGTTSVIRLGDLRVTGLGKGRQSPAGTERLQSVFSCLKRLAHRAENCGVTDVDKRVGDEASAAAVADSGQLLGV